MCTGAGSGWPGIGTASSSPRASTPGNTRRSAAAAAGALGAPPRRQSVKSYSDCRAGLLNETRPQSTSEIRRTPQPSSVRATAQPSVPAARARARPLGRPGASGRVLLCQIG